jgi:hypothetical protein
MHGTIDEPSRFDCTSNPKTGITDKREAPTSGSGDEPMTGAQAFYLEMLSEQANEDMFEMGLTKAEAAKRIDELRHKVKIGTA